jgi:hypothetical protein
MLDIDIAGDVIDPVVAALTLKRIPFLFVSGVAEAAVSKRYPSAQFIDKPCTAAQLLRAVQSL